MKTLILTILTFTALASYALVVERNVFPTEVSASQEIHIKISFKNVKSSGYAKIVENLPAGFKAEVKETMGGVVMSDEGKLRIVWLSLPQTNNFEISYKLINVNQVSGKFSVDGKFNYIENDERKTEGIEKTNFKINPVKTKQEPVNEELLSKEIIVKSETKTLTKEEKPNTSLQNNTDEIIYKIQLGAFSKEKPSSSFGDLPNVHFEKVNNLFKYYTGNFTDEKAAKELMERAKNSGYPGAFMVRFKNGQRL
jgi:hypothetical protein